MNDGLCYLAEDSVLRKRKLSKKQEHWPVNSQTAWCPAGTTTVWSGLGSLHTCSDKLARWNCLGLQGSLLSSVLKDPLYMSSLTVGRKFSAATSRRAICCRLAQRSDRHDSHHHAAAASDSSSPNFRLNHPTVMGTAVYMDETGVIDMTVPNDAGQDVRFFSSKSWASWMLTSKEHVVECIDASAGFAASSDASSMQQEQQLLTRTSGNQRASKISTLALVESFLEIESVLRQSSRLSCSNDDTALTTNFLAEPTRSVPATLRELRVLKSSISSPYETFKNKLLTKHPVLRDWKRREEQLQSNETV